MLNTELHGTSRNIRHILIAPSHVSWKHAQNTIWKPPRFENKVEEKHNHPWRCPSRILPKITCAPVQTVQTCPKSPSTHLAKCIYFFRLDYNTICEDQHKTKAVLLCALDYLKKGGGKSQTQKADAKVADANRKRHLISCSCLTSNYNNLITSNWSK